MSKKAQEGSSIFCPEDVPEAGDLNQSEGQNAPDFPDESSENDMSGIVLADLDFVETTCRKMLKQISTMAGSIRNLEHVSKLWRERNGTSYGRGMYSVDALSTAENKAKTQFLSTLESVYRIEIRTPIKIIEAAPFPLPAGGRPFEDDIKVVVADGAIYAKTPLLFNRNKHWHITDVVDYYTFFAEDVDQKIQAIDHELPLFKYKNVNTLSVYPANRKTLPDADNIDTKVIVDALTRYLPGGDSGICCTFSQAVIATEFLAPGTYFTVSRGYAKTPDFEANIRALQRVFPNHPIADFEP